MESENLKENEGRKREKKKEGKNLLLLIKNAREREWKQSFASKIGTESIKLELVGLGCVGEK